MVKKSHRWVVVGVDGLIERFHPIADGDMGDLDYAFDFAVAQPEIQLQRLGNIVVVYFFADFVNGKSSCILQRYLLFAVMTPLCDLSLGISGIKSPCIKFCINIVN
jgi:hypothetical protein